MPTKNRGRLKTKSRFNTPIKKSPFLEDFQEILLHRIFLTKKHVFTYKKLEQFIKDVLGKNPASLKFRFDKIPIYLDLGIEEYWQIQETAKKVTGSVMPMDELIKILLGYFVRCYSGKYVRKNYQPFMVRRPSKRGENLKKFKIKFGVYFKNHLTEIPK